MKFNRFIALGDSMTEGMCDEIVDGLYRGWADRVADILAKNSEDFSYANFAVRGKLISQVIEDQLPLAIELVDGPTTLISFHAGANDVIRPKYDPIQTIARYNQAVDILKRTDATLMLFCVLEDSGVKSKSAALWKTRFHIFNQNIREKASEVGAILLDPNSDDFWQDPRFLDSDRLHLNAEGHRRVAQAVLARFGLPHDENWRRKLPPAEPISQREKLLSDLRWLRSFLIPWMIRRARGRSSGDGRRAKYPGLTRWPVEGREPRF
jgi:lysophospholipase L1-like esterase